MSKIITKSQISLVIESTLKEVNYMKENEDAVKLTKDHMDELHDKGHCMCGDKCLVYPEAVHNDSKKSYDVVKLVAEKDGDCIIMEKQHMDMLEKDGKCDCNGVTLTYDENMVEGDHMEDGMNENKEMCPECGGLIKEGLCEAGCGYSANMGEEGVDEGNEFTGELSKAREKGENTFTVDGKTYKVEATDSVEESVNDITESIKNTVNKNLINEEEMNFFNKMVNYKK
jgi:hypothetical protein